jgi:RecA-family ATPase
MAKRYIQTIPNPANNGPRVGIFYPDTDLGREHPDAVEFARKWDVPGQAVYDAINLFKDDATERAVETAAEYERVACDIDLKDIEEPTDKVVEALTKLPYPPSEIRHSGHGIHADWVLKERLSAATEAEAIKKVRGRLAEFLCADPAINHDAALLRRCGTTNSKDRTNPVVCHTIAAAGYTYDLHDIDDLVDDYAGRPLFTRKEKPARNNKSNGGGKHIPVDVERELAEMSWQGKNGPDLNSTYKRVSCRLLREGHTPDEVEEIWVAAVMACSDREGLGWSRAWEVEDVRRRLASTMNDMAEHSPNELPWLTPEQLEAWQKIVSEGRHPQLTRNGGGWYVRRSREFAHQDHNNDAKPTGSKDHDPPPGARAKILVLRPFVSFDPATLPPREWLYGKHYQRRTVSLTAGPGGMGKSSLVLVECIAMATGRALLNEQPMERLRVWVHNGEDPLIEIHRRVAAICLHYGIPQTELEGYLWLTSGTEFPLRVAKGYTNLEINDGLVRQISNVIGENQIDLAAFDPLVTLHSVSEGDPGKMDTVIRVFASIADEHDAGIELNHHVRKPAAGIESDIDLHDIRGAMAITDAVRAARVLNRMNKGDAENAGVSEITRLAYFRVDKAKGNYSPAQAAVWRRFINVPLPNTDEEGVVTPWDFPGQGAQTPEKMAADIRAERTLLQILDKYEARGANVSANPGPTYLPSRFAAEKEAKAEKVSKVALKAAMMRLLDKGTVVSEPARADGRSHRITRAKVDENAA